MPLDLEEDWAVVRPNRRLQEQEVASPAEPTGYVWVAFCYRGDRLTGPRVRIPIPTEKELVERSMGACMLDVFRVVCPISDVVDDWIPDTDVYVDRLLLYLTEKGAPCIAEASGDRMPILNLGMAQSIDLAFIVSGHGKLTVLHRRFGFAHWEVAPWDNARTSELVEWLPQPEASDEESISDINQEVRAFGLGLREGRGMSIQEVLDAEPYYPPGLSKY